MNENVFYLIYYTEMAINVIFYILNVAIAVFICFEWRKSKSIFKSPYFYILNSFYITELIFNVDWVYVRQINYDLSHPLLPLLIFIQWYVQCFQGFCEFSLGLSRCTALAFPTLHTMLWEKKRWIFFMVLIYAFPFISHGYVFARFDCKFMSSGAEGCLKYRQNSNFVISVMTISLNAACLSVVFIGLIFSPKSYHTTQKTEMEKRLTLQVIIHSVSNILLYIENFFHLFTETYDYKVMSYLFWMLQYYPSMLIIFFLTPTVRTEFAAFYMGMAKKIGGGSGASVSVY